MPINEISSTNRNSQQRPMINLKNTGYTALAGVGAAMVTGMSKNKTLYKSHKYCAWVALVAAAAHLYVILAGRKKRNSRF